MPKPSEEQSNSAPVPPLVGSCMGQPDRKAKRPENWPFFLTDTSQRVGRDWIVVDHGLQPRVATDPSLVKRYQTAMESGSQFPPVKLADIEGTLHLICGFHRYDAATVKGEQQYVEAEIVKMTRKEAMWAAASDNLENGQRYTGDDWRKVFHMFVKAGKHHKGKGEYLSYREIAQLLTIKKSTVHNWMHKDFPDTARRMGDEKEGNHDAMQPDHDPEAERLLLAERAMQEAWLHLQHLSSPEKRFDGFQTLTAIHQKASRLPMKEPVKDF